jgi:predicted regulator of Ras-like GTPase activity (Roadblock/LC7/MglB family)
LQAYQKVLSLTPDVSDAHLAVAEIYLLHGLPLEAYDELRKVFELEPGRPEAHLLLHEIEPLAPIPAELERLSQRFPSPLQIAETRARLSLEIEHLVREVEQLREQGEGPSSEPVAAYHLEQARKRLSRTQHLLGLLQTLPTGAPPEPPRPELLLPEPEPEPELPPLPELESYEEPAGEPQSYEEPEPTYETREMEPEYDEPAPEEELPDLDELLAGVPEPEGDSQDIEEFFSSLAIDEPQATEPFDELPELPVMEPEPEPEPEPELAEEPEPEPEPIPAGPSPQRVAYYESISGALRDSVDELLRTRGLTSIFVVSTDGHVVAYQARDKVSPEQMGDLVVQIQSCLRASSDDLAYWALECEGGIVLMQQLDDRHVLVAVGQAGASFAMIRLNLDKAKPRLAEPLAGAPHD